MDEELEEYERHLYQKLAELQRSYQAAAKPIVDDLVRIQNMKPPKPIIITRLLDGTASLPKSTD